MCRFRCETVPTSRSNKASDVRDIGTKRTSSMRGNVRLGPIAGIAAPTNFVRGGILLPIRGV